MPNQQMIDSWHRSQAQYPQARHYTPGHQRTQYRTTERGRPMAMNLLVVVHNDAPPADVGLQRVDVIVNSGSFDRAAEHANGHLVNVYDEQAGITDHTAIYSEADLARIWQRSGRPVELRDRDGGGPPGAQVYGVVAQLRQNERGELVIDTAAPMEPSFGASRYSLHDVQAGMDLAAQRDLGLERAPAHGAQEQRMTRQEYIDRQRELMPDLDHSVPAHGSGRPAPVPAPRAGAVPVYGTGLTPEQRAQYAREGAARQRPGVSSQVGLGSLAGPRNSVPSSPAPGQPGSRFNPNVVQRRPRPQAPVAPGMVTSADVPKTQPQPSREEQKDQKAAKGAQRRAGADLDRRMAKDGLRTGVQGAQLGAKAGSAVPGLGTAAGGAIGAAAGISAGSSKTAIEAGDSKRAFRAAMPLGGVAGGAVAAKLAADQRQKQAGGPQPHEQAPAKGPTAGERFKETRLGQAVHSEEFRSGAKRVGTEAARQAAQGADRAKRLGADAKGVAAGAAKGAATGFVQGVRAEMSGKDGSKSVAAGMVDGLGRTVADQKGREQAKAAAEAQRPVHETYDYQFEDPEPGGGESQYGG